MAKDELEIKQCGWTYDHEPHHIVQHSQASFNCPGYNGLEEARYWSEHGG